MPPIKIRRAKEADAEAVVAVWKEMALLHQKWEPAVWALVAEPETPALNYYRGFINHKHIVFFVAEENQQIIGFLSACQGSRPPVLRQRPYGQILECCVAAKARRKGVGRLLVAKAFAWFKKQGVEEIKVNYATKNAAAKKFWQALDFRPYQATAILALKPAPKKK